MAAPEVSSAQLFDQALVALVRAYREASEAIDQERDPQRGFERASALADKLRQLAESAADRRARIAVHIWEKEKISLAELGNRIGISKARAGQLVQSVKKKKEVKDG